MKFTSILAASIFSLGCFAQEEQIKSINTIEQANDFAAENTELEGLVWNIVPEIDPSNDTGFFDGKKTGDVFSDGNFMYKVLSTKKVVAHRVSYIFLDGSKLTVDAINKLRKTILEKYKSGTPFADLALEYTMDGNQTGDLNWFTDGMMDAEFEKAVKKHKHNDIFTVDIPYNKWYYVTLKTFQDKELEELTLLSVKKKK